MIEHRGLRNRRAGQKHGRRCSGRSSPGSRRLLLGVLPLAACFLLLNGSGPSREPVVVVGLIAPFSGDLATIGRSTEEGARLAVEEINRGGGVNTGAGRLRLELLPGDSEGRPEGALQAAQLLINRDKVAALVGPVFSSTAVPVAALAEQTGVLMITPSATSPQVTRGRSYVYRACFTDDFQGRIMARFAREELKAATAAVLYDRTNLYNRGIAQVFSEEFRRLGGEVVAFHGYTPEVQDFSPLLRDVARRNPGVLVLPNYRPDKFHQVRQARELGISAPILGSDTMAVSDPEECALLEGVYYTTHFARQAPGSKVAEFSRRYREVYGKEPTLNGALTYDAVMLLARALEHYDPDNPEQVHARMRTGTFEGVTGTVELGPGAPVKSCVVMQFRGGTDRFIMSYLP